MRFPLLVIALTPLSAGCPNTDAAVFVEPTIENPAVAVSGGVLGTDVKGSFRLKLHLGARASGPSTVNIEKFSIVDASHSAVVDPLKLTADKTLPVTVSQDNDVVVSLSFDTGANPLAKDVSAQLCAGDLTIQGAIDDSLENTATGVDSGPFKATGCP